MVHTLSQTTTTLQEKLAKFIDYGAWWTKGSFVTKVFLWRLSLDASGQPRQLESCGRLHLHIPHQPEHPRIASFFIIASR